LSGHHANGRAACAAVVIFGVMNRQLQPWRVVYIHPVTRRRIAIPCKTVFDAFRIRRDVIQRSGQPEIWYVCDDGQRVDDVDAVLRALGMRLTARQLRRMYPA